MRRVWEYMVFRWNHKEEWKQSWIRHCGFSYAILSWRTTTPVRTTSCFHISYNCTPRQKKRKTTIGLFWGNGIDDSHRKLTMMKKKQWKFWELAGHLNFHPIPRGKRRTFFSTVVVVSCHCQHWPNEPYRIISFCCYNYIICSLFPLPCPLLQTFRCQLHPRNTTFQLVRPPPLFENGMDGWICVGSVNKLYPVCFVCVDKFG